MAPRKTLKKRVGGLFGMFSKKYIVDPKAPVMNANGKLYSRSLPDPQNYDARTFISSSDGGKTWSKATGGPVTAYDSFVRQKETDQAEAQWNAATQDQKLAAINSKLNEIGVRRRMARVKPDLDAPIMESTRNAWLKSYNAFDQGYLVDPSGKYISGGKKSKKTKRRRA
jgi:hypothetical protein